ncbi:nuclear transport factor 2 family protein [Rheinheimera pleomorphica]|uniref:nuclear transport factor 2 family protein n=1 Tax=Rheinheimera pleomorphica TaxID=2703963 RepID=UPI001582099F|nr:nuclear transport factor 2 family protein [Rheinheimera pleomorphica]
MNAIDTPRITQLLNFYNALSANNMQTLADIYHPEVVFIDPVHEIHGRAALAQYFSHAYARLQHCEFIGLDRLEQAEQGFLSWRMKFCHPAIGNGKAVAVDGCTVLRWQDGLIVYHRDYYDLNEMVYQHLPVIGWLTTKVKQRMANTAP